MGEVRTQAYKKLTSEFDKQQSILPITSAFIILSRIIDVSWLNECLTRFIWHNLSVQEADDCCILCFICLLLKTLTVIRECTTRPISLSYLIFQKFLIAWTTTFSCTYLTPACFSTGTYCILHFLSNRSQYERFGTVTSSTLPWTHGILQGSILSPLLFTSIHSLHHLFTIYSEGLQIGALCTRLLWSLISFAFNKPWHLLIVHKGRFAKTC